MEEQGYNIKENILYQDNQSAMKVILNGKRSSSAKLKHLDNRFCWFKDRLGWEGIKVKYCPTGQMVADFFTKPLQGAQFKKLRDVVMGYAHIDSLENGDSINEERVGSNQDQDKGSGINSSKALIEGQTILEKGPGTKKPMTWADVVQGNNKEIGVREDENLLILSKQSKL